MKKGSPGDYDAAALQKSRVLAFGSNTTNVLQSTEELISTG
jgi:hypothetical protein